MRRRSETTERIGAGLRERLGWSNEPLPATMQTLLLRLATKDAERLPVPHRVSA